MVKAGKSIKYLSIFLSFCVMVVLILCISSYQVVNAQSSLVLNGDFESGDSSDWSGYGNWEVVDNNANTGTYCARIQPESAFEQVIEGLTPSTIYTLKAKVKVENESTKVYVGAKQFGGQEVCYIVSPLEYTDVIVNFRTGVNCTSARIYLYMDDRTSGYSYGDDFSVYPFEVPDTEYNVYFGGLHDHTGYSDGQGTADEAFEYAKDYGDFLTITDHNTFGLARQISDSEWAETIASSNRNSVYNEFIGLTGYEMTTEVFHANVYNTEYYYKWAKSLSNFYDCLVDDPNCIAQFNHPGWDDRGRFDDFGHYSKELDNVIELLEVGNGYGPIDRSGNYGWYYGTYVTALDKGWHVAPTNNQDNHKPTWLQEMPTRTAVLAHTLDRANIIDAIKNKRVYSSEDENLKIIYRVNDEIMGTILDSPQELNFNIDIENPEQDVAIKEIRVVADGGRVVNSKQCTSNVDSWNFSMSPEYSYYFVYVILDDGSVAVTAPVWTGLSVAPKMTPKITLETTPKTSHEKFVVNVSGLRPSHLTDWIGLYEEDENPDGSPRSIWFSNLQNLHIDDNGTGSFIFNPDEIPDDERERYQPNGTYKFIYAHDDEYSVVKSTSFTINSNGVSLPNNLALNKTVTASSYWDNQPDSKEQNAVDGDEDTCWNAGRDSSAGEWIEVDLGEPTTFNKVVLKSNLDRICGYKIQYFNGTEYVDIVNGAQICPLKEDVFEAVTAQKVRIYVLNTKTDQKDWGFSPRIDEFEIYNDANARMPIKDLALYKTAAASSNWEDNEDRPTGAFDGSEESTWNAGRGTSSGEWLEVDLGEPTTFNTISMTTYLNRVSSYKLQYYNGSDWIDIYNGGYISPSKYIRFPDITSSKIRIYIMSTQTDQNDWGDDAAINSIAVYKQ